MSVNGMGFRAIERIKGVHHTTVLYWLKQVGNLLPDAYQFSDSISNLLTLSDSQAKGDSWLQE